MTDLRFPNGDDDLTRGLRGLYAAPAGHAYWNELEARIMARVAEVELGWWTELDRWLRPALVAAAVLIVSAGVAMFQAQKTETESAYEELFAPTPVPGAPVEASAVQRSAPEPRDNALRFIISR
ncbi:MAG TPA: hypothetical protein VFO55_07275 [Gemmatimonadaceae bacterium]|nr:hypothetical protein [Gemmatimonadaceae bacterium]